MNEQDKAFARRSKDPKFLNRWFVGRGIDIGCGNDPINPAQWPNITEIVPYDRIIDPSHDAETVPQYGEEFTFVHASHCLEHMTDVWATLGRWWELIIPGGFLIFTVPDFSLYEHHVWPSQFNSDHKHKFTTSLKISHEYHAIYPSSIYYGPAFRVEKMELLSEHFDPYLPSNVDQTLGRAECAIEVVVQKLPNIDPVPLWTSVQIESDSDE